ncbi:hypothetical protein MM817_03012 [Acidibacillus sp. S0AB]|uniref:Major facilitator superfamily (MFS) profile domain-containing protein n=1 Tax=Sulfoacidibacillus ferrooxidans TaxID=2005001 RepID=A0A9X1VCE6_9BACL|nr:hypothetical protein [Sulfoacidibacillus ferrooxidans]
MSSYMSIYFHNQFALNPIEPADIVSLLALAGSVSRPVGGWLADRIGASRILQVVFGLLFISTISMLWFQSRRAVEADLLLIMILFGLDNGALFQFLP